MRKPRLLRILTGMLLLATGLVMLPLPIPLGLPLSLAGLGLLVTVCPRVRELVRRVRGNAPTVSRRLDQSAPRVPRPLARLIRVTRPRAKRVPLRARADSGRE